MILIFELDLTYRWLCRTLIWRNWIKETQSLRSMSCRYGNENLSLFCFTWLLVIKL